MDKTKKKLMEFLDSNLEAKLYVSTFSLMKQNPRNSQEIVCYDCGRIVGYIFIGYSDAKYRTISKATTFSVDNLLELAEVLKGLERNIRRYYRNDIEQK